MKEKVLWLDFLKNMYRKVTEDGRVKIPKPAPLVGGGEVYQNDDVPYWYCDIKGRDTFMHVYMEDLTEEDLLYTKAGDERDFCDTRMQKFKDDALEALANKPKEGFRWIPVYEPSYTPRGGVQFVAGKSPLVGVSCSEWDKILKQYSPENESGMGLKATYFLLLLRFIKDCVTSPDILVNHSADIGFYKDSEYKNKRFYGSEVREYWEKRKEAEYHLRRVENTRYLPRAKIGEQWDPPRRMSLDIENTGERKFGGLYGFVGNTGKIVKDPNSFDGYSILGGNCLEKGKNAPVTNVRRKDGYYYISNPNVGFLELKK